jgi:hypothetical protein
MRVTAGGEGKQDEATHVIRRSRNQAAGRRKSAGHKPLRAGVQLSMHPKVLRAVLALVAGCSFPEKHPGFDDGGQGSNADGSSQELDAQPDGRSLDAPATGPFACLGQPFSAQTNQPSLTFTGTFQVADITTGTQTPIGGAPTHAFFNGAGHPMAWGTQTDANGHFDVSYTPVAGQGIDGWIEADPPAGYAPAQAFPSKPFVVDALDLPLTTFDHTTMMTLYSSLGVPYDGTSAVLIVSVVDCNGHPVAGAQLVAIPHAGIQPPGAIKYFVQSHIDPNATSTDQSGQAIAVGQPTGSDFPDAQYTAMVPNVGRLHTYTYHLVPGALVFAAIQP